MIEGLPRNTEVTHGQCLRCGYPGIQPQLCCAECGMTPLEAATFVARTAAKYATIALATGFSYGVSTVLVLPSLLIRLQFVASAGAPGVSRGPLLDTYQIISILCAAVATSILALLLRHLWRFGVGKQAFLAVNTASWMGLSLLFTGVQLILLLLLIPY